MRTHFEPAAVDSSAINLHLVCNKTSVPENWCRYVTWKVKLRLSVFEETLNLYTYTHTKFLYKCICMYKHTYCFIHLGMGNFHRNFEGEFSNL